MSFMVMKLSSHPIKLQPSYWHVNKSDDMECHKILHEISIETALVSPTSSQRFVHFDEPFFRVLFSCVNFRV